ncbi:MAG TPA: DoxX family protein [Candidatus Methylomirabilis sp.]|nr:DoxX family protein [Candidatus Methylomirabilis sp.]
MSKLLTTLRSWHGKFFHFVDYLQHPFLLFVRLYWGIQLLQSGWGKLHHLDNVTDYFTTLNLPMPHQMAIFISCIEFFGGLFLALGLLSRVTCVVLTINLIMAYVIGDREALLSIFSNPDKFTAAAPYVFLIASLIVLVFGPGIFSLDALANRVFWKASPSDKSPA